MVAEHKRTYGIADGYEDDSALYDLNGCEEVATNVDEAKQYISENYPEIAKEELDNCDYMNEIWNLLDEHGYGENYSVCGYTEDYNSIVPNTLFLTKRACQDHIDKNDYHYDHPHTYAMTAWRSPEFEKFIKLFKSANLDKI